MKVDARTLDAGPYPSMCAPQNASFPGLVYQVPRLRSMKRAAKEWIGIRGLKYATLRGQKRGDAGRGEFAAPGFRPIFDGRPPPRRSQREPRPRRGRIVARTRGRLWREIYEEQHVPRRDIDL
jgi:hypothetical protein